MNWNYLVNLSSGRKEMLERVRDVTGLSFADQFRMLVDFGYQAGVLNQWIPIVSGKIQEK